MTYLLDVNALVALGFYEHSFHERVVRWLATLDPETELATCSITELGFVRVLAQVPQYRITIAQGRALLAELKANRKRRFCFIADTQGVDQLPEWVSTARQTTDGHLAVLAAAHNATLATLDEGIPGAHIL